MTYHVIVEQSIAPSKTYTKQAKPRGAPERAEICSTVREQRPKQCRENSAVTLTCLAHDICDTKPWEQMISSAHFYIRVPTPESPDLSLRALPKSGSAKNVNIVNMRQFGFWLASIVRKVTGAQNSQHVGFTSQFKSRPSLVTLADSTFARAVEGLPRERILTVLVFGGHILCANQTLPVYSTKSYEIHALPFLNLFNEVHLEYHYASGAPLQLVSWFSHNLWSSKIHSQ